MSFESFTAGPSANAELFRAEPAVVDCYALFDKFFPTCGLLDYSEGMYFGDPAMPLETAQLNQIRYVLDEINCRAGARILEIGCGNGTLLDEVRRRGAEGVGITISPEQVALCRRRGLDVELVNYRSLGVEWTRRFDAVVANGPIEHFVQPRDAAAGRADLIYRQMFRIFHRVIDPDSPIRRFINTTIHFARTPQPSALMVSPRNHPRGSDNWHWSWLERSFGGFYPTDGQFERCAAGRFALAKQVDGTEDYRFTSEEWLRRMKEALHSRQGLKILARALPFALRHIRQTFDMLTFMLAT
ncbi:MAG TPA: class I SAM-dependent methyltransferase, partial [Pirellulales bacterium]|nr:class I SAM-dependent methyltransferase [Pirellulales bacterium]